MSKTLLYICKEPNKSKVVLLGSTEKSAVNIAGTKIYSGLGTKPEPKLSGSNDNLKLL